MKLIEFTAHYKLGHTHMRVRTTIAARNIQTIQEIVEEIPEFMDGVRSCVEYPTGARVLSTDKYEDLVAKYEEAMKEDL